MRARAARSVIVFRWNQAQAYMLKSSVAPHRPPTPSRRTVHHRLTDNATYGPRMKNNPLVIQSLSDLSACSELSPAASGVRRQKTNARMEKPATRKTRPLVAVAGFVTLRIARQGAREKNMARTLYLSTLAGCQEAMLSYPAWKVTLVSGSWKVSNVCANPGGKSAERRRCSALRRLVPGIHPGDESGLSVVTSSSAGDSVPSADAALPMMAGILRRRERK